MICLLITNKTYLLQELESHGTLTGNHVQMIVWRNHNSTRLLQEVVRSLLACARLKFAKDNVCAYLHKLTAREV